MLLAGLELQQAVVLDTVEPHTEALADAHTAAAGAADSHIVAERVADNQTADNHIEVDYSFAEVAGTFV